MTTTERTEDGYSRYTLGIGLLGVRLPSSAPHTQLEAARLEMIERRILRLEAACKDHGINLDQWDLDA